MRTSTTGKKKFTSIIGTILMAFVFASVIDGLSIGPAFGQDRAIPARDRYERRGHDRGRWDRDRWDRDRWDRGRWEHGRRYYRPYAYGVPVYAPPPVYIPPPPPPPGISIFFPPIIIR